MNIRKLLFGKKKDPLLQSNKTLPKVCNTIDRNKNMAAISRHPSGERIETTLEHHESVRIPVAVPFLDGVANRKRAVVGIDFGTTHSGFAFALTSDPNGVFTQKTRGKEKQPTCALFDRKTRKLVAYGFQARDMYLRLLAGEELLIRFTAGTSKLAGEYLYFDGNIKMGLWGDKRDKGSLECTTVGGQYKVPLIEVVAAILQHLKVEALKTIRADTSEVDITVGEVLWVLTVPAIWRDEDKQFMRLASYEAGIIASVEDSDLLIALEPECAAIMVQAEGYPLEEGNKVLTLDCGGGTVDICCVEIMETGNRIKMRQLLEPTGGDWGSTKIDKKFYDFLRDLIGERNLKHCYTKPAALLELRNGWEELKCRLVASDFVKGAKDQQLSMASVLGEIKMKLPELVKRYNKSALCTRGKVSYVKSLFKESTVLLLPPQILISFFQPVIQNIVDHVSYLLEHYRLGDLSHIMLVGGLGSCDLLRKTLNDSFSKTIGRDCIVADRPAAAVEIGAVAFGMQPGVVASRKARLTIGLKATVEYNSNKHRKHSPYMKYKFLDKASNKYYIRNVFKPFVIRGEDVDTTSEVTHTFEPMHKSWESVKFDIYVSEDTEVTLVNAEGCRRLAKIVVPVEPNQEPKPRLQCALKFGFTEIVATVTNLMTGKAEAIPLQYDMVQDDGVEIDLTSNEKKQ